MSTADASCQTFQLELPDLLYGELEDERRQQAEAHAKGCAGCRELLADLRAVRAALPPPPAAPPHLAARLKLAARDELLARRAPPHPPTPSPFAAGGPLHLMVLALLAACVLGFGLGIAYQQRRAPRPGPSGLSDAQPPPPPTSEPRPSLDPEVPPRFSGARSPEAWQRVLHDAGQRLLSRDEHAQAREFFLRAAAVAADGPLAAEARTGAAEALLRAGRRAEAHTELEEVRRSVLGGTAPGSARLLQRIHELIEESQRDR